jgi:hypothetical protein
MNMKQLCLVVVFVMIVCYKQICCICKALNEFEFIYIP